MALLHNVREAQSALAAVVSPKLRPTPNGESLERLLARLPDRLLEEQENSGPETAGATAEYPSGRGKTLLRSVVRRAGLQDSNASAVALLGRLQAVEPDRFIRAQPRTLQRRVQQWPGIMANKLFYVASEATPPDLGRISEMGLLGDDPKC